MNPTLTTRFPDKQSAPGCYTQQESTVAITAQKVSIDLLERHRAAVFGDVRQMTNYMELPLGEKTPKLVTCVIEIPQDSVNKYEYDKTLHVFRLDRNLYSPVHYPGDYGFIPQTLAMDGDPLDILILGDAPSFPGCVLTARPVGLFKMLDQGVEDEKVLAFAAANPTFSHIESYKSCYPQTLREIEHFFSIYKDLEGKRTQVIGWGDVEEARDIITACHTRYQEAAQCATKR